MLGTELAGADDTAADGDAGLLAAVVLSAAGVDGLFDEDAAAAMMAIATAPTAMNALSTLCRAGHDLRFCLLCPFGVCGGIADCCCHGGGWGGYCCQPGPYCGWPPLTGFP